jgi:hypothetical protein
LPLYSTLFTTCFSPYGPSAGEVQYHLHFSKYYQCCNGSTVILYFTWRWPVGAETCRE